MKWTLIGTKLNLPRRRLLKVTTLSFAKTNGSEHTQNTEFFIIHLIYINRKVP
jgi:hypothetical protein